MKDISYENYFWQNDKVRLRAIKEEDWKGHYYNKFDSTGRRLVNYDVGLPPTESDARSFVEEYGDFSQKSGRIMFTIENLDNENVGGINLNSIDQRNGTFCIGLQIDQDHRGEGYGTAAMRILLRYAFYERRLNKYYGSMIETNTGSARMHEKLGCSKEGRRRQMVFTDGKYNDEILYGITKEEFIEVDQNNNI